jgi:tol-pal system protein YbgF
MALIMLNNFPGGTMRRIDGIIFAFAGLTILAAGCASQDVIVQKQTEMEARLEFLIQNNKSTSRQISEISAELKDIKDREQSNAAKMQQLEATLKETRVAASGNTPGNRPALPQTSVAKIELINSDTASKSKSDAASAAYMKAFGLYSADQYGMAIDSFNAFLEAFPSTAYAANAQYWLGECYYSQSDLPKAIEAFRKVVDKYPKGKKTPDAMLKIGYTLIAMKEPEKAREILTTLSEKFPESPAAGKARERLKGL